MAQVSPYPAPTHRQVCAAMRFYDEISSALVALLENDPNVGKIDCKDIIEKTIVRLVEKDTMTSDIARRHFGLIPSTPLEQRHWCEGHIILADKMNNAVLGHHQLAYFGQIDTGETDDRDHLTVLADFLMHYRMMPHA